MSRKQERKIEYTYYVPTNRGQYEREEDNEEYFIMGHREMAKVFGITDLTFIDWLKAGNVELPSWGGKTSKKFLSKTMLLVLLARLFRAKVTKSARKRAEMTLLALEWCRSNGVEPYQFRLSFELESFLSSPAPDGFTALALEAVREEREEGRDTQEIEAKIQARRP